MASPTNEMREMARVIVQRFYQCLERGCEEDLEDAITAALTEARREGVAEGRDRSMLVTTEEAFKQGAEAVRERAVAKMDATRASFVTDEFAVGGDVHAQIIAGMCADAIRALPLTGKGDAVPLLYIIKKVANDLADALARLDQTPEASNG